MAGADRLEGGHRGEDEAGAAAAADLALDIVDLRGEDKRLLGALRI